MSFRFGLSEGGTIVKRHVYLYLGLKKCRFVRSSCILVKDFLLPDVPKLLYRCTWHCKSQRLLTTSRHYVLWHSKPTNPVLYQPSHFQKPKQAQPTLTTSRTQASFGAPHRSIILLFAANQAFTLLGTHPGNWLLSA